MTLSGFKAYSTIGISHLKSSLSLIHLDDESAGHEFQKHVSQRPLGAGLLKCRMASELILQGAILMVRKVFITANAKLDRVQDSKQVKQFEQSASSSDDSSQLDTRINYSPLVIASDVIQDVLNVHDPLTSHNLIFSLVPINSKGKLHTSVAIEFPNPIGCPLAHDRIQDFNLDVYLNGIRQKPNDLGDIVLWCTFERNGVHSSVMKIIEHLNLKAATSSAPDSTMEAKAPGLFTINFRAPLHLHSKRVSVTNLIYPSNPINLPSWVDRLIRIVRKSSSADQNPWHVAVPSSHYKTFEDVFIVLLHELRHNYSLNILYLDSTPYLMGPADLLHLEMAVDFSKYLGFYHERFQKNGARIQIPLTKINTRVIFNEHTRLDQPNFACSNNSENCTFSNLPHKHPIQGYEYFKLDPFGASNANLNLFTPSFINLECVQVIPQICNDHRMAKTLITLPTNGSTLESKVRGVGDRTTAFEPPELYQFTPYTLNKLPLFNGSFTNLQFRLLDMKARVVEFRTDTDCSLIIELCIER